MFAGNLAPFGQPPAPSPGGAVDDISGYFSATPAQGGDDISGYFLAVPAKEGPPYYGNAEPEGATAYVGGAERATGGWAAYEVTRRRARWEAAPQGGCEPSRYYPGRTYISGNDVLESLFAPPPTQGGSVERTDPLAGAAERLAASLERLDAALAAPGPGSLWARLGLAPDRVLTLPALTPAAVRGARPETDTRELHALAEEVSLLAAAAGEDPVPVPAPPAGLPPIPQRAVAVGDDPGVARLEEGTIPRAEAVDAYRGQVAACFDAAAAALARAAPPGEGGGARIEDKGGGA